VAIDIRELLKQRPIGAVETVLGKLYVYSMTVGGQKELHEALGKEIEKTEHNEFMEELVRFIAYPEGSAIGDEKLKPENVVITKDDVKKMSDDDLQAIASTFLDGSDYLFRKSIRKTSPDSSGGTRVSFEKGGIKYPQNDNETKVMYLHRLCCLEEQRLKDDAIKITNKFKLFSDQLGKDIQQTLNMGEALRGTLGTVRPIAYETPSYRSAIPNLADLARQKEERQLRPLRDLAAKMDKLIEQSSLSTEFMIENNRVQTEIAEELKESGDKAAGFSKQNLFFTKVVIGITVASVVIPIIFFIISRFDSAEQTKQTKEHVTNITNAIKDLVQQEKLPAHENAQLNKILEELRLQRLQTSKRIDTLERQVRELEIQKRR